MSVQLIETAKLIIALQFLFLLSIIRFIWDLFIIHFIGMQGHRIPFNEIEVIIIISILFL